MQWRQHDAAIQTKNNNNSLCKVGQSEKKQFLLSLLVANEPNEMEETLSHIAVRIFCIKMGLEL